MMHVFFGAEISLLIFWRREVSHDLDRFKVLNYLVATCQYNEFVICFIRLFNAYFN